MVFKNLCVLVFWTYVALALAGLKIKGDHDEVGRPVLHTNTQGVQVGIIWNIAILMIALQRLVIVYHITNTSNKDQEKKKKQYNYDGVHTFKMDPLS